MNNLSLYEITNAFPILMEKEEIDEEERLIVIEELKNLLNEKSQNIIGYTKNLELTIEAMKTEEKRISDNRKVLENRLAKFKDYVKECMEKGGFTKIETELGVLSIAKSPISVEIIDESEVPEQFKTEVITTKIDKKTITDNFKETGEIPNGVKINTDNTYLKIK